MTSPRGNHLRVVPVVPFSTTDHDGGKHLTELSGEVTSNLKEVDAKLAFILAWSEQSFSTASVPGAVTLTMPCTLSVDMDEKVPTELYLTFEDGEIRRRLGLLKKLRINIELFRTCYQFETDVIQTDPDDEADSPLILKIPQSITTLRARNLPRVKLTAEEIKMIPPPTWHGDNGQKLNFIEFSEVGLNSLVGRLEGKREADSGHVAFGELLLKARFVRMKDGLEIFQLTIDNSEVFGHFFELYRRIAFPNLMPRGEINADAIFELYIKTRYLSQFLGENIDLALKEELLRTWRNTALAQHHGTVDYITVDEDRNPCGASSAARAFGGQTESIWAFHQLCSVRSPSLLECSGQLYSWRAEYLFGSPEPLKVVGWFRSESRWLERIYVKFANLTRGRSSIRPITWIKGEYRQSTAGCETPGKIPVHDVTYGELMRSTAKGEPDSFGAVGPDYFNACAALNGVFNLTKDMLSIDECKDIADSLLKHQKREKAVMHFTLAPNATIPPGFEKHPSDRFFVIQKADLGDFLSCVEHSIALTRKKLHA